MSRLELGVGAGLMIVRDRHDNGSYTVLHAVSLEMPRTPTLAEMLTAVDLAEHECRRWVAAHMPDRAGELDDDRDDDSEVAACDEPSCVDGSIHDQGYVDPCGRCVDREAAS